eukprot:6028717-Prymnesium_polylepis.1
MQGSGMGEGGAARPGRAAMRGALTRGRRRCLRVCGVCGRAWACVWRERRLNDASAGAWRSPRVDAPCTPRRFAPHVPTVRKGPVLVRCTIPIPMRCPRTFDSVQRYTTRWCTTSGQLKFSNLSSG